MAVYPVFAVANDIIDKAAKEGICMSNLKLQKMLYFLYGHFFVKSDYPLIDEKFQTWPYGPVIPIVYGRAQKFGALGITEYLLDQEGYFYVTDKLADNYIETFEYVWNKYSHIPALTLSKLTHAPQSPWDVVTKEKGLYKEIPPELIKKYFRGESISAQK
ncbi:MAG TPA: type II toxin-antitoxin system antitoxin SocA domain-containing protein [Clostridia bacterium]